MEFCDYNGCQKKAATKDETKATTTMRVGGEGQRKKQTQGIHQSINN